MTSAGITPAPTANQDTKTSATQKTGRSPGGATPSTPTSPYFYPISGGAKMGDIDNGVDFEGGYPSNLIAICDGVIVNTEGQFPGGSIVLKMDHPWHGHQWVYYGHLNHSEQGCVQVHNGQRVAGGQIIGHTSRTPVCDGGCPAGHTEIGFCRDEGGVIQTGGHFAGDRTKGTSWGADFHKLLGEIKNHTAQPGAGGTSGGGSAGDALGIAKATAFATFLELPGLLDSKESLALQGAKSLMNDKPLLPFVEQLCKASLRSFQSMPNGHFFAFFPDYFGGLDHRTPYWEIQDIEVIDGNIQLSDDALATHVYTVGDISGFDGQVTFEDRVLSAGVVTIFNAFEADFLNGILTSDLSTTTAADAKNKLQKAQDTPSVPGKVDKLTLDKRGTPTFKNNKDAALAFLQKYGARPSYQEAPFIRSPFFELFLAYQTFMLMWSKQFLTTFEFTFMPELFPGGLVAFPDHGIQCFIDEVVHEGSYEQGFTTKANLSAPAALKDNNQKPIGPRNVHAGMIRAFSLGNELPYFANFDPAKKK